MFLSFEKKLDNLYFLRKNKLIYYFLFDQFRVKKWLFQIQIPFENRQSIKD